jgi:hypothetical protein
LAGSKRKPSDLTDDLLKIVEEASAPVTEVGNAKKETDQDHGSKKMQSQKLDYFIDPHQSISSYRRLYNLAGQSSASNHLFGGRVFPL